MDINGVDLQWLGHSGFLIKNSKIIYIDPYNIREGTEKADIILITHSHYDHCSVADIQKIIKPGTVILVTADAQSKILRFDVPVQIQIVEPNQSFEFGNVKVETLPAYNLDKHFHTKEEGWVGYLVKVDNALIYHAGDTDLIPEMQKLTGYGHNRKMLVALLPVGGRFTMTAEEAFEAAKLIKPDIAIPMHYGSVVGEENDAQEFCNLCNEKNIKTEVLEKQ